MARKEARTMAPLKPSTTPVTVTITEATTLIERPEGTIRDWVKKGLVTAKPDSRGRWLIERDSLLHRASTLPSAKAARHPRTLSPEPTTPSIEGSTQAHIRTLEQTLDRERRINDDMRDQVKRLENEIFKLSHEMQALLSKDTPTGVLSRWVKSKIS
jgi:hypothetical protein